MVMNRVHPLRLRRFGIAPIVRAAVVQSRDTKAGGLLERSRMSPEHPSQATPPRCSVDTTGHSWADPKPVSKSLDLRFPRARCAPAFVCVGLRWIGTGHHRGA